MLRGRFDAATVLGYRDRADAYGSALGDLAFLATLDAETGLVLPSVMQCCGRPEDELHTADCPSAMAQDLAEYGYVCDCGKGDLCPEFGKSFTRPALHVWYD